MARAVSALWSAIDVGWRRALSVQGRANRSNFWLWILFVAVLHACALWLDSVTGWKVRGEGLAFLATRVVLLVPTWTYLVRRFHDRDWSGWWTLLALMPFVGIFIVLLWATLPGAKGANRFGIPDAGGSGGTPRRAPDPSQGTRI